MMHEAIIREFSALTAPLIERLQSNQDESEILAATRDLLLPKLMSGELHVRDAQKVVETIA